MRQDFVKHMGKRMQHHLRDRKEDHLFSFTHVVTQREESEECNVHTPGKRTSHALTDLSNALKYPYTEYEYPYTPYE